MSTPTFVPPVDPSVDYESDTKFRILEAEFGDGYSQRAGDGLNSVTEEPKLRFAAVTAANKDEIVGFMKALKGYLPFIYTLPDEAEARKFRCNSLNRKHLGNQLWDVTLELKEVFDL